MSSFLGEQELPTSAEMLCREARPWGGGRTSAHTCHGAPLAETLVQLRPSCLLEFKANIYILRLLCIYVGLPAPLSVFGKLLLVSSC